jgi:osmotically-inducible protein OsmY
MVAALLSLKRPPWPHWLGGMALWLIGSVTMAEPPHCLPTGPMSVSSDARLTFLARRALLDDETLTPFNVGVQVRDGIATLIGRVPSKDLVTRAESCVRLVQGLRDVRNELLVGPASEDAPLKVPKAAPAPAATGPAVSLLAPVPFAPTDHHPAATPSVLFSAPFVGHDEQLLSSGKPPGQFAGISATTSMLPLRTVSDPDLRAAVEQVRWSEPRFLRIEVEVRDGTVSLRGQVLRGEDGMDLARQVARLPGVADVIIRTREAPLLPGHTP